MQVFADLRAVFAVFGDLVVLATALVLYRDAWAAQARARPDKRLDHRSRALLAGLLVFAFVLLILNALTSQ
jgi:hypothetical protein